MKHQAFRLPPLSLRALALGWLCVLLSMTFVPRSVFPAEPPRVAEELQALMNAEGAAGYCIHFRQRADLSGAKALGWTARGKFVVEALRKTAEEAQGRVLKFLETHGVACRSFWIANLILVERSDRALLDRLLDFPEIAWITARSAIPLPAPSVEDIIGERDTPGIEENITHVKADQVWAMGYNGGGVTVANIDSGVRYTHQALTGKYRGNLGGSFDHNYNWYDPTGLCGDTPCDNNNHGSHTMGTMVGDDGSGNRIGMAPGASWMACKGCGTSDCADATLLSCGQFLLAPTDLQGNNPDPGRRPHVINNSIGREGGNPWYQDMVDAWQAAGIYPVFSNGNAGPRCATAGSPGDYPNVTAVGNVNHRTDLPWETSSRGPGHYEKTINPMGYPYLKPQVSAPGVQIRSSIGSADDAYKSDTGTSMAAPHVAGLVALMLQAAPCLGYAEVEKTIMETAVPILFPTGCGDEGPDGLPNNATGWGLIDALEAVTAIVERCGKTGALQGRVTSRGGPIPGARVTTATHLSNTTDAEGFFLFPYIPEGEQPVSVSAFGYYGKSATVTVSGGQTTTRDFLLRPKPAVLLQGTVSDGSGAGWPLYASVHVFSPGFQTTIHTDPLTGRYALPLHRDTPYTLTVSSQGYAPETRSFTPDALCADQDFTLLTDKTCGAPGYEDIRLLYEAFEGEFPPSGWSTLALNGTTNLWKRNDVFLRPNLTGATGFCADADSEATCYASKWDAVLVSPEIPMPPAGPLTLFWKQRFFQQGPGAEAWLEASIDGGASWQSLSHWIFGDAPTDEALDLSAYKGTTPRLRWRYVSGWCDFYWQIDDVKVVSGCRPKEGGLVTGRVLDGNTRIPLEGVTVEMGGPETVTTDAKGVYVLFGPAGKTTVSATPPAPSGYGTTEAPVQVLDGKVAGRDLCLPAGRLVAFPRRLGVRLLPGKSLKLPLVLRNRGGKDVAFHFGPLEVPWASVEPASGSLVANTGKACAEVTFRAEGLPEGTYTTTLTVISDTPYSLSIPLTLKVVGP